MSLKCTVLKTQRYQAGTAQLHSKETPKVLPSTHLRGRELLCDFGKVALQFCRITTPGVFRAAAAALLPLVAPSAISKRTTCPGSHRRATTRAAAGV